MVSVHVQDGKIMMVEWVEWSTMDMKMKMKMKMGVGGLYVRVFVRLRVCIIRINEMARKGGEIKVAAIER